MKKLIVFAVIAATVFACNNHLPEDTDDFTWKEKPKDTLKLIIHARQGNDSTHRAIASLVKK